MKRLLDEPINWADFLTAEESALLDRWTVPDFVRLLRKLSQRDLLVAFTFANKMFELIAEHDVPLLPDPPWADKLTTPSPLSLFRASLATRTAADENDPKSTAGQ